MLSKLWFSSSNVWMWEVDIKKAEGWKIDAFKLWCWRSTPESPLDSKEIKLVNPKGNQPWISIGRTIAEALILWPPDEKRDKSLIQFLLVGWAVFPLCCLTWNQTMVELLKIMVISFRTDWLDLLAVQGTLKSLLQHHSSKASSVLSFLYGPTLTSIHDYWKNHSLDYVDLCQQSNVCAF